MYSLPSMDSFPFFAACGFRAEFEEIVVLDHLGLDETALEIGVDDTRRLRGAVMPSVMVQARTSFTPR